MTNGDGSSTTTINDTNSDGSLRDKSATTLSADGLTKTVQLDANGDGTYDRTTTDATVNNAGGGRTETVSEASANGTSLGKTVTVYGADEVSRTVTVDANGDGLTTAQEVVAVGNAGTTTDTSSALNADGSLIARSVATTSADGLTKTVQTDHAGSGTFDLTTSDAIAHNAGGGSTETVAATNADGSSRGKSVTTTSASGLAKSNQTDLTGDGTFDVTTNDNTVVNSDNSQVETIATTSANGTLLQRATLNTSADHRTVSINRDANGDGHTTQQETVSVGNDGTVTDSVNDLNPDASLIDRTVTTTSANGLNKKTQVDQAGTGSFNLTSTDNTTLNANGSTTETRTDSNGDNSTRDSTTINTSGNGLSKTTANDYDGNGTIDLTTTDNVVINADGSRTETVRDTNNNGSLRDTTVSTTSANGLSSTVAHDFDGNGTTDLTTSDGSTLNADGSTTEVLTDTNAHGIRDQSTINTSADRKTVTAQRQYNGSVTFSENETATVTANGNTIDTLTVTGASGTPIDTVATTTSANGLSQTVQKDVNGDGTFDVTTSDVTVLNADGSTTETKSETGTGGILVGKTVTTTSGNGLTKTFESDENGDGTFDLVTIDGTVINADGSQTETITQKNADGSLRGQTVTSTSADRRTATVTSSYGTDGTQTDATVLGPSANNTDVETVTSRNGSGALLGTKTITTNANGLQRTTVATDANGATLDQEIDTTSLRNEHFTDHDRGIANSDIASTVSANGLVKTIQANLNGYSGFSYTSSDTTTLNADGSNTEVITDSVGGQFADQATVSLSADALTKTFALQETNSGRNDLTDTTAYGTDGSKTETLTVLNTATGAQQQKDVITTSADGRTTTLQSARKF